MILIGHLDPTHDWRPSNNKDCLKMSQMLAKIGSFWTGGPLSWIEYASIQSFVDLGHDYALYSYEPIANVPNGAQMRDAREVWNTETIIIHEKAQSPAIHADIFRAIMVRNTGRIWADTDIIALRPMPVDLNWFIGHERSDKEMLGNAIMGFPPKSATMMKMVDFLTSDFPIPPWYSDNKRKNMARRRDRGEKLHLGSLPWGTTGPDLLTYFANETGEIEHAQPQGAFFPVAFPNRKMLVRAVDCEATKAVINEADSYCVHLYSRWLRKFTADNPGGYPEPDSWLGRYLNSKSLVDYAAYKRTQSEANQTNNKRENLASIVADDFYPDHATRTVRRPLPATTSRHGKLLLATMVKDEGPYVLEWVAYHLSRGFTDLLVLSNDCTDGTDEMLLALHDLGLISYLANDPWLGKSPQQRGIARIMAHPLYKNADWVMLMDIDEFLVIKTPNAIADELIDLIVSKDATAMPITWRFFGANGLDKYDPSLVIERFTMAAADDFRKTGVKTLFKRSPDMKLAIHRPHLLRKYLKAKEKSLRWINPNGAILNGREVRWKYESDEVGYDFAQVNHYAIKSGEEYLMRQLRGDVLDNHSKYNPKYFLESNRNDIKDTGAQAHADAVQRTMNHLLNIPTVASADALIKVRTQEKISRLRSAADHMNKLSNLGFEV